MRIMTLKVLSAAVHDTRWKNAETLGRKGNKETSYNDMENLVHFNHISNMLHVLMGSRPVSTRRTNMFYARQRSTYIDEITKMSLFRFDTAVNYTVGNTTKLITTTTTGRKAFKDSNRKFAIFSKNGEKSESLLTWDMVRRKSMFSHQYRDALAVIDGFVNFIGHERTDYELIDLLVMMRDYPEWMVKMNGIKNISPILNFLNQSSKSNAGLTNVKSPNMAGMSIQRYPLKAVVFDATIILFLRDEDAMNIINGKQVATLLDSGTVFVEGNPSSIYDLDYIDENTIEKRRDDYLANGFADVKNFPLTIYGKKSRSYDSTCGVVHHSKDTEKQ